MAIETASLRDLNNLRRMESICFERDAWSLLDLIGVLTIPDVVRLKAVQDGQMVGFVAGDPRSSKGFSWIATICVLPEYRRQGIGRALLLGCEQRLRTPRLRLSVRKSNRGAIRLYEQEGYRTIDIWRRYYDDGEDAVVMEKRPESNVL
ncbi:MAG: GNAT family N-acetyltransferase [Anaerolineales bacterium]|nr:GNAT family N-acetyltransferase [Anaerolineales bacterium]